MVITLIQEHLEPLLILRPLAMIQLPPIRIHYPNLLITYLPREVDPSKEHNKSNSHNLQLLPLRVLGVLEGTVDVHGDDEVTVGEGSVEHPFDPGEGVCFYDGGESSSCEGLFDEGLGLGGGEEADSGVVLGARVDRGGCGIGVGVGGGGVGGVVLGSVSKEVLGLESVCLVDSHDDYDE